MCKLSPHVNCVFLEQVTLSKAVVREGGHDICVHYAKAVLSGEDY